MVWLRHLRLRNLTQECRKNRFVTRTSRWFHQNSPVELTHQIPSKTPKMMTAQEAVQVVKSGTLESITIIFLSIINFKQYYTTRPPK